MPPINCVASRNLLVFCHVAVRRHHLLSAAVGRVAFGGGQRDLLKTTMPKDMVHVRELKEQRIAKANLMDAKGYTKVVPAKVSLCVLGNGGPGNPPALVLMTDQKSYMFNCGEGTQRLANEHK